MTIDLKALVGADSISQSTSVALPHLAVIEVTGKDAESFLHGQFTQRLTNLGDEFVLAAYCQPKGRMLATMRVWRNEKAFFLLIARDLLESFVKRLSMFVLRSDVKIRVAEELAVTGCINSTETLPEAEHIAIGANGAVIARLPNFEGITRAYCITKTEESCTNTDDTLWHVLDIVSGLGHVEETTREAFVPQWLNFDRAHGMVFDKGCYPGQEVIARIQHIGKTSRRMFTAVANAVLNLAPNETVLVADEPATIVTSRVLGDHTFALVVLPAETPADTELSINETPFIVTQPPYGL